MDTGWLRNSFLMLSGGIAGVCSPTGEMRTFCTVESFTSRMNEMIEEETLFSSWHVMVSLSSDAIFCRLILVSLLYIVNHGER